MLAHSIGSLLNQLFGKGKDPFWRQAYTAIELHRLEADPCFTLQDVYRLAIAPDGFRDRLEALQRWHRLDPKLRTSVVEGLSSFLSLFDQPEVAQAFCPPRDRPHGGRRLLPPMEELVACWP